jgi:DNA-binding HxlR family transcriptional regulator
MAKIPAETPSLCTRFHRASELIGRRWTGAIIFVLMESRCRFATLRKEIPDITDRMLSERLFELEQEGIVERTVIPETPVRVEYALTRKGRELAAAVDAIGDWARKWIETDSTRRGGSSPTGRGGSSLTGRGGSLDPPKVAASKTSARRKSA